MTLYSDDVRIEHTRLLDRQRSIYSRFHEFMSQPGPLTKNPAFPSSAYLVAWYYDLSFQIKIKEILSQVQSCSPLMVYPYQTLHTTISDFLLTNSVDKPAGDVYRRLSSVMLAISKSMKTPSIRFGKVLVNANSVILPGEPDTAFTEAALVIKTLAARDGMTLRMPTMSHITLARVKSDASEEVAKQLTRLVRYIPALGEVKPAGITVGHFTLTDRDFRFNQKTDFPL
ncbi:MAG TPA: hypothetical protein VLI92_01925 [Candidatus Saccharimonadales bacterium]|nr:hypothetical protein [Candidatus Saccharimonadales bacterium]